MSGKDDDSAKRFVTLQDSGDAALLVLGGAWNIRNVKALERAVKQGRAKQDKAAYRIDASAITALDTTGAWLLKELIEGAQEPPVLSDTQQKLLAFLPPRAPEMPHPQQPFFLTEFFTAAGKAVYDGVRFHYDIFSFCGRIFFRFLANFRHPRHFRFASITRHIYETGIRALPIIALLAFFISMVVAYQGAAQLRRFGADIFTIDLTVISILREMGVLITAIMVAGRSGSAFAAEIGVMKLRHEVDALETMGLDPIETLVLPRLIALLITLPLLTMFANMVGLFGGALMVQGVLDIGLVQFYDRAAQVATLSMFFVGMIKAPVFAFLIAVVCCYQGMNVSGSAESVGRLTTVAVVQSIFLVILADGLFSIVFALVGI